VVAPEQGLEEEIGRLSMPDGKPVFGCPLERGSVLGSGLHFSFALRKQRKKPPRTLYSQFSGDIGENRFYSGKGQL
jgi:hypothetical protein